MPPPTQHNDRRKQRNIPNLAAMQAIKQVALLVHDQDEALAFYIGKLGFHVLEDLLQESGKRRIVITPSGGGCSLVLALATTAEQQLRVGDQSGGRVFLYLHTDDIHSDFEKLKSAGVKITRTPTEADFGTALVFEDLYGNRWDLVQPSE